MIILRLTLTDRPTQPVSVRDIISGQRELLIRTLADNFQVVTHDLMLYTQVVTDEAVSYNLPDLLFEITTCNVSPPHPYADQLQENLLAACPSLARIHWMVYLSSRQDHYAVSRHRPN